MVTIQPGFRVAVEFNNCILYIHRNVTVQKIHSLFSTEEVKVIIGYMHVQRLNVSRSYHNYVKQYIAYNL